jgi:hypothetical protein
MTPKLSSALSELDASTLPPEITIHHDSVAVRRTALEQIAKMGNQDLIKSVLAREIDNGLINIATQKLESDLSNISLMCQVAKNSGNLNSVVNYLLQLLKNKEIERFVLNFEKKIFYFNGMIFSKQKNKQFPLTFYFYSGI